MEQRINATLKRATSAAPHARLRALAWPWVREESPDGDCWCAGNLSNAAGLFAAARAGDVGRLKTLLREERTQFGFVVETENSIVAAVDRVHGYSLFLKEHDGQVELTHDPTPWIAELGRSQFDEEQARLFLLAGYCIGRGTLLRPVTQLLPGEFVVLDKRTGGVARHRYYVFEPRFDGDGTPAGWQKRLAEALDASVQRTMKQANGGRIWLSLSAGFDSRVILGKLLQHGCKDLATFSYGTPGNMEARVARDLAESVGARWQFVAPQGRADIRDYWEGEGASYMFYGAGAQTTPVFNEFYFFRQLRDSGAIGQDDLIVNGQTGDYITGGHIHPNAALDRGGLAHYTWKKHFSLIESESERFGRAGVDRLLAGWQAEYSTARRSDGKYDALADYLAFEWQERQSRYVVNQHRANDFLGLRWSTPLWGSDLMDLYEGVPFDLQFQQKLYVDYLQSWNYRGLFDEMRRPYDPWHRMRPLVLGMGRAAGLFGNAAKQTVYDQLYYYSDQHYLYRLFGWRVFHGLWRELRTPASLVALDYLLRIRRLLGIAPVSTVERRFAELNATRLRNVPLPNGGLRCAS